MIKPGYILIALVPLLPWLGWWMRGDTAEAIMQAPVLLFVLAMLGCLAVYVYKVDRWFGLLCGWVTLAVLWHPNGFAYEVAEALTFGVLGIIAVSNLGEQARRVGLALITVSACVQAVLAIGEAFGYEWVWDHLYDKPMGMLGNGGYLGMYLALALPVSPWWTWPLLGGGLLASQSVTAVIASMIGAAVQVGSRTALLSIVLLGLLAILLVLPVRDRAETMTLRVDVWKMAWQQSSWKAMIVGHGPGTWSWQVPRMQRATGVRPQQLFIEAHNEWMQTGYEFGAVGLGLIGAWLWTHRAIFRTAMAGSLVTALLLTVTWFPLRLATTGLFVIIILGMAMNLSREQNTTPSESVPTERTRGDVPVASLAST